MRESAGEEAMRPVEGRAGEVFQHLEELCGGARSGALLASRKCSGVNCAFYIDRLFSRLIHPSKFVHIITYLVKLKAK